MEELTGILNKISLEDMEKLKVLLSIMPDHAQNEVVTLRLFINEYLHLIKNNLSINYYNSVSISLKHLTDYFGEQRSISSIAFKDVELFITHLQKRVPKGFRVYYRTLKAAFNKAVDWNYISVNHFTKIKLPKQQKSNPKFISDEQLRLICSKIEVEVVREFIVTAFFTGMRLSELVNLKWQNVDFNKRIITVGDDEFETKGRNQRYVPICDEVGKVLEKRMTKDVEKQRSEKAKSKSENGETCKSENVETENVRREKTIILPLDNIEKKGFVFGKDNGMAFTGDYFSKRFKRACRNAGLDEAIHFHTLRHSFASNLAQQGVSLYVIKELLGHSSITTTEIYSHLNVDALREAVKNFDTNPASFNNKLRRDSGSEIGDMRREPPLILPLNNNGETFEKNEGLKLLKYKG